MAVLPSTTPTAESLWGFEPTLTVCPRCDRRFLMHAGQATARCPHCFLANLDGLSADLATLGENLPYLQPPELITPHSLTPERIGERVRAFAVGIPYPPADLTPKSLLQRLQRLYLPVWLVDASVQADWQTEAGFDYQVVSHQDRYNDNSGGWRSQEVKEDRVRWEPRRGSLERTYSNIPLPALEDHSSLRRLLGEFSTSTSVPYDSKQTDGAFIRLPDRSQQDAWPDTVPALQTAAARECQQAAGADHIRDFRWSPKFPNRNWTLMLLPVYTSYYLDDDGLPQPVMIHGQTGAVTGARRASLKRAQRTSLIALAIAAVLFIISIMIGVGGIALPLLLPLGVIGVVAAVLVALGALIPLVSAWSFNRQKIAHHQ